MYTQFFGNFLLSRGVITSEQLIEAIQEESKAHMKLGTLAIHAGYMTASEAENILIMQTHEDKRFGDLAIQGGYMTKEQVDQLVKMQKPNYLLLGQILIDKGYLTMNEFENLIVDYQSENEIYDLDMVDEKKETVTEMLRNYCNFDNHPDAEKAIDYLYLLFNNLVRFIGEDFTALNPIPCPEYPTNYCICQKTHGENFSVTSAIDIDMNAAIAFASRYVHEEFDDFDEYVKASLEDFLNLHNGLYNVNLSNDFSLELSLDPPVVHHCDVLTLSKGAYLFPVVYPFGTVNFLFSFS